MIGQQTLHDDAAVGVEIVMTLSIPPQSLQRMRVSWRLGCGATPLPSLDAVPPRLAADSPIAWLDAAAVAAISR